MNYREKFFAANPSNHGWYTCAKCGKKLRKAEVDVDHIIPQKYGGKDELYNLQCLCKHCNRSKQAKLKGVASNLVKHNVKRAVKKIREKLPTR
ncbi:MAG: HNH endonuclease [Selenomonadaceae bacterium]|nr:HNH endonuclease [Selenomonadaceae bacterium]